MSHTKEPWRIDGYTVFGQDENEVEIAGDVGVFVTSAHKNDAKRIVACVNACAGIPTDDLKMCPEGGLFHLADHANQLVIQRDELLAALVRAERKLSAYVGVCTGDKELTDAVMPMVRSAIASAKGESS